MTTFNVRTLNEFVDVLKENITRIILYERYYDSCFIQKMIMYMFVSGLRKDFIPKSLFKMLYILCKQNIWGTFETKIFLSRYQS